LAKELGVRFFRDKEKIIKELDEIEARDRNMAGGKNYGGRNDSNQNN